MQISSDAELISPVRNPHLVQASPDRAQPLPARDRASNTAVRNAHSIPSLGWN